MLMFSRDPKQLCFFRALFQEVSFSNESFLKRGVLLIKHVDYGTPTELGFAKLFSLFSQNNILPSLFLDLSILDALYEAFLCVSVCSLSHLGNLHK